MVTSNGTERPAWFREWAAKYGAEIATAFILHFNTADYVQVRVDEDEKALSLRNFLSAAFGKRDVIAIYNRAEGITFPYQCASAMRERFIGEMGLGAQLDETEKALWEARNPGKKPEEAALPTSPRECLQLLEQLLKRTESTVDVDEETGQGQPLKSVVIVEGAELVVPNADIAAMSPDDRTVLAILQRWGRDEEIADAGNPVILITQNLTDIHESLRAASSRYEAIAIPIPTEEERLSFVEYLLAKTDSRTGERWAPVGILGEISPAQLARMTAGLNRLHVEDLFLRALEEGGVLTEEMVKDRKYAIISSEFDEVIEVMEPKFGFEALGGLEQVKGFFRRNVIGPLKTGNRNRCPMGVLMVGPAGTGKSLAAQCVAKESGLNCINLNLAKILGQYVGNSERNMEKALRAIQGLAPVIVFIDELDQAFQRGSSGDSGVSSRLFSRLLQFMANTSNRGRVVFMAASNRPDMIDAALKRPGRFDKIVAFLVPNEAERGQIILANLKRSSAQLTGLVGETFSIVADDPRWEGLLQRTDNWTGAELEGLVVKAWEIAEDGGRETVGVGDLVDAVDRLRPSTADIEWMTELALREVNDRDLLPAAYSNRLDNRKQIEEKIRELAPRGKRGREI